MKALFIVDTLGAGGAERSLQELLPHYAAAGVKPVVAAFHARKEGVEDRVKSAFDFRLLPGRRWQQMAALRSLAKAGGFELIHSCLFEADVFGRAAVAGLAVPVVTSLVNMPYEPSRLQHDPNVDRVKLFAAQSLEVATARIATHFHAITAAVKQAAVRRLLIPPERISVVHRGRDPERLGRASSERRRAARAALNLRDEDFVILNAARQEYQKGQRYLIEALRVADQSSVLLIAGRAGNASSDLKAASADLGDRVRFLGHRDDVPDLLAASDVFVLPSLWEGLGCALLEAMALELPIVATDLAPIREVLQHEQTALLVPPTDIAALAVAITRLQQDAGLRAALGQRARARFEQHFTLARSADAMLALFDSVIQSHRPIRRPA